MNREIKFRAWNIEDKVMEYLPSIWNDSCMFDGDGDDVTEWPVMQFTGLLDKHGKEIYEGDILVPVRNTGFKEPPKGLLCQVVWDDEWVSFKGLKDNKQDGEYTLTTGNCEKHWEIIGNLYENPDLLLTQ